MVQVIYGVELCASLDGFVAAADGGVDWLQPFGAAGVDHFAELMKEVGAILIGSRTYEQMLEFGGAESFGKPCFVFSSAIWWWRGKDVSQSHKTRRTGACQTGVSRDKPGVALRRNASIHLLPRSGAYHRVFAWDRAGSAGKRTAALRITRPRCHSATDRSKPHPTGVLMVRYQVVQ